MGGSSSLYYYKDFKIVECQRYTENGNINFDTVIGKDINVDDAVNFNNKRVDYIIGNIILIML